MEIQIVTERLILRNYHENDLENLHRLKSDPLVWKYSSNNSTNDVDDTRIILANLIKKYSEGINDFQALFLKSTDEYIGEAGILSMNKKNQRVVIGYNLIPKYWGKGYATEIILALVKYLFDQENTERIEALVLEENMASRRVLEKSGFLAEGLLRNFAYIDNNYCNVYYYGLIRKDYEDGR